MAKAKTDTKATAPDAASAAQAGSLVLAPQVSAELLMIERAAANPRVDVKKMKELLNMRKEAKADDARLAYSQAMRLVQQEIQPVVRDVENTHTSSKYAKLEKIDAAIRPIYTAHGFSLSFDSETMPDGEIKITCEIAHIDGHIVTRSLQGALDVSGSAGKANKTKIQGLGSSVSYLRRYLTCMIFNVVMKDEDNDGNGEGGKKKTDDAFANRVNKTADKVSDAVFTEVKDFLVILPDESKCKRFKTIKGAAAYLAKELALITDAQLRLDALLDNTEVMKGLEAISEQGTIAELHKIAKGPKNGK